MKVVQTHQKLAKFLQTGLTLANIDAFVARALDELGCRSCFLHYRAGRVPPFPSHACLSLNDCVVHGTAGYHTEPMVEGDLLKIDIGVMYRGWVGDAAWTYSFGEMSPEVKALTDCGKESINRGIAALKPGGEWIDWARAVQDYVEGECGFHLVRNLGGHGYGRSLHAAPFVSNVVPSAMSRYTWPDAHKSVLPGTLVALEPMIAVGTGNTEQRSNQWPVYTADGSMSVHYEHDVYIAEDGPEVLTAELAELNDIIG